jgi:hypothetical protein
MHASVTDDHPSRRPTRELSEQPAAARRPPCAPLFGLAPARACRVSLPPKRASSLWRWSSPRGGRALPASLLCGARTFLGRGLSTDAPAAVRPPPGILILPDSNACSKRHCRRRAYRPTSWPGRTAVAWPMRRGMGIRPLSVRYARGAGTPRLSAARAVRRWRRCSDDRRPCSARAGRGRRCSPRSRGAGP